MKAVKGGGRAQCVEYSERGRYSDEETIMSYARVLERVLLMIVGKCDDVNLDNSVDRYW